MSIILVSDTNSSKFINSLASRKQTVTRCSFSDTSDLLNSCQADVVLIDCEANVKKGLKKLREIKQQCPKIPVIFITAESSESLAIDAFRLGAKDYYKKPVNTVQLKKTITNLARIKNHSSENRTPFLYSAGPVSSVYDKINTTIPENLLRAITYIEDNLDKEIHLEMMAHVAGMSKHHFGRVFKKHLEMSPMHFLSFMRVEKAKSILKCTSHSMTFIADTVGFNDLSTFNRTFKNYAGVSPSSFRKTLLMNRAKKKSIKP